MVKGFYQDSSVIHRERRLRSILKTITWRGVAAIDTFIITWFFTYKASIALGVASVELITKIVLFYLHERSWSYIKWGYKIKVSQNNSHPGNNT